MYCLSVGLDSLSRAPLVAWYSGLRTDPACWAQGPSKHRAPADEPCAALHAAALDVDSGGSGEFPKYSSRLGFLFFRLWHGVSDRNDSVNTLPFADWKGPLRRHSLYHADSAYSENRFRVYFVDTVAKSKSNPTPTMDVIKNKDSEETGIQLDFELDSSSGDETDPDQTQALDIQASPDETPPVSPVMQREADGIKLPQNMPETRDVRFKASADSEGRRKPPTFLKFKSQEVSREMKGPRGKTIRQCIDKIEKLIIATHGSQAEKVAAVTKVVAIAVELADADQKAKAAQRRRERVLERRKLTAALKAQQAEAARIEMQEAQVAVMNKH